MKKGGASKVCISPECGKQFTPGHYGDLQKVCGRVECRRWYQRHWSATAAPPRGLPKEIYNKLERAAKAEWPFRRFVMLVVARESGRRKGEVLGLTWGDVLESNGKVRSVVALRGQWDDCRGFVPTKTGASSRMYVLPKSVKLLGQLRMEAKAEKLTGRVFPFWESGVWGWWVALQRKFGIANSTTQKPFRWHDLRHTVGTELVGAGRIDLAKEMLGHRNVNTTMKYAQPRSEDVLGQVQEIRRASKVRRRKDG